MEKNLFIAIILTLLILLIYSSPQYQKRFRKEIPIPPDVEQTENDSLRERKAVTPALKESTVDRVTEPEMTLLPEHGTVIEQIQDPSAEEKFTLENEDLKIRISTRGGVISEVILKKFMGTREEDSVQLVTDGETWYDGHIKDDDLYIPLSDFIFSQQSVSQNHAVLEAELIGGKTITREFTLDTEGYILKAQTRLSGNWNTPLLLFSWHGPLNDTETPFNQLRIWPFTMFMRDENTIYKKIVYLGQGGLKKIEAKKQGRGKDEFFGDLDWYAIRSKYFMTAAIPYEMMRWNAQSTFSLNGDEKWFDFTVSKLISNGDTSLDIYLGPISYDTLKKYGRNLTESMELSFRFIRPLSIGFLWLIKKIYSVIPNWGIVIIVFSLIIKIILYPLSKSSFTSMRKMSTLQPQINELRLKHKNNPQMLHRATMDLYKKEGVNPFSGCLPMLIQMPVFFALYPVVGRAFELRQALFIPHWIEDLSRPDPFYILPVAMGVSMFFQQRTTMKDPNQKAMLYIMPVMMVILFANFSSGLTLYWFLFNILTYLQQKIHSPKLIT